MPAIPHVYRRGGTYWFRKNHALFLCRFADIRLSLRTSCARTARHLACELRAASLGIEDMMNQAIRTTATISDSALTSMGRRAYDDLLGHLRERHSAPGNELGTQIRLNRCIADMFGLLKTVGQPFELGDDVLDVLREKHGWDEQRLDDLIDTFTVYENGALAFNDTRILSYLEDQGLEPTQANLVATARTLLPYYHDAARQAHARLCVGGSMHPLPDEPSTEANMDIRAVLNAIARTTVAAPVPANPVAIPTPPVSQLVSDFIECRTGSLDPGSLVQVRKAFDLFIFENGDLPIGAVEQRHLGAMVRLLKRLPSTYGITRAELDEGLAASVRRGEEMKASGKKVGLSQTTINRHLTWISSVITYAKATMGLKPAEPLEFGLLRKTSNKVASKTRQNEKRAAWTPDEVRSLLKAPPFTGSAGLHHRMTEGDMVYHDAWYFGPLGLALHGFRSSEFIGLSLAEVKEDATIPHIDLKDTTYRKLKTASSIRAVPIHPEIIRLGFIDYISELRRLDLDLVFPEMQSPACTMDFDSAFMKQIFSKMREYCFPNGTEWYRENSSAKEKDVHSLRGYASNGMIGNAHQEVREDVLGHTGKGETRRTYDEAAPLPLKLMAIESLGAVTSHLEPVPLNLRPIGELCYRPRRGRRKAP